MARSSSTDRAVPTNINLLFADLEHPRVRDFNPLTFFGIAVRQMQHWAIAVNGIVYEIDTHGRKDDFDVKISQLAEWRDKKAAKNLDVETICVGSTVRSDDTIKRLAHYVWDNYFNCKYQTLDKNCQTFSFLLIGLIAINPKAISKEKAKLLPKMPGRTSGLRTAVKRFGPWMGIAGVLKYLASLGIIGYSSVKIGVGLFGVAPPAILLGIILVAIISIPFAVKHQDEKWLRNRRKRLDEILLPMGNIEQDDVKIILAADGQPQDTGPPAYEVGDWDSVRDFADRSAGKLVYNSTEVDYQDYNRDSIDKFVGMGFAPERVIAVFRSWGFTSNYGTYINLNEEESETIIDGLLAN